MFWTQDFQLLAVSLLNGIIGITENVSSDEKDNIKHNRVSMGLHPAQRANKKKVKNVSGSQQLENYDTKNRKIGCFNRSHCSTLLHKHVPDALTIITTSGSSTSRGVNKCNICTTLSL